MSRELELKSMLVHDFVHLAVESEAGLRDSFFGSLCCEPSEGAYHELPQTEKVVGALQGALKGTVNPAEFVDRLAAYLDDVGDEVPKWLTPELVGRAVGRFRQIHGHWKATPFGQTMELTFPLDPI